MNPVSLLVAYDFFGKDTFENFIPSIGINLWLSVIGKLILAGALILPHSLHAAPRVEKEELKQLRSRIESLQEELADTEESKSGAADALRESEQAISAANRKLTALARQQHEANGQAKPIKSTVRADREGY